MLHYFRNVYETLHHFTSFTLNVAKVYPFNQLVLYVPSELSTDKKVIWLFGKRFYSELFYESLNYLLSNTLKFTTGILKIVFISLQFTFHLKKDAIKVNLIKKYFDKRTKRKKCCALKTLHNQI